MEGLNQCVEYYFYCSAFSSSTRKFILMVSSALSLIHMSIMLKYPIVNFVRTYLRIWMKCLHMLSAMRGTGIQLYLI